MWLHSRLAQSWPAAWTAIPCYLLALTIAEVLATDNAHAANLEIVAALTL
jgi:hypothetical protein